MSIKLYADNRCIAEYKDDPKDAYNCPNCGAPIKSYICEYCGTEFEKPEKKLTDEEIRESFAEFARKQKQAEIQASQEWQTQNLLNTLNIYGINTQIMNVRDSINASMALQSCSLYDQMYNASMQTNIYPVKNDIEQKIPNNKGDNKAIDKEKPDNHISKADEELASAMTIFMIGMILFTIFAIVVTVIYNL